MNMYSRRPSNLLVPPEPRVPSTHCDLMGVEAVGVAGSEDPSPHRFFKFLATSDSYYTANGVRWIMLWRLSVYASTTGTGTDLALLRPAVASSYSGGDVAAGAVDGSDATAWASVSSPASYQWIYVDLGPGAPAVKSMVLRPNVGPGSVETLPASALLQSSKDAVSWTTFNTLSIPNLGTGVARTFSSLQ